jgi:hypothetical protein
VPKGQGETCSDLSKPTSFALRLVFPFYPFAFLEKAICGRRDSCRRRPAKLRHVHICLVPPKGGGASACHRDGVRIACLERLTGDHLQCAHWGCRDAQKDDNDTGSSQPGQRLGESDASECSARFPARLPKDAGPACRRHRATASECTLQ